MDQRQQALAHWLSTACKLSAAELVPMTGDASFRRYFRVNTQDATLVAMDAPPGREDCRSYVAIANGLRKKNLRAPLVSASDTTQGFLLLEDFGDNVYLKTLNSTNADTLYTRALDTLAVMQTCHYIPDCNLPQFNVDFIYQELQVFKEWFLLRHLNLALSPATEKMLTDFFYFLANSASSQPQVFMHRDYHSANLMVLPEQQVGILDFQDAFIGPVTYDLVSLLRDCYIAWPESQVKKWVLDYHAKINAPVSADTFYRWFDLMGLQRHLKALLTFARKCHRDHNVNYLQHIPRTLNYIASAAPRYDEARDFTDFLGTEILPALDKVSICAP
jgi:aminoglycoside/choline kinase family phosphotransferase